MTAQAPDFDGLLQRLQTIEHETQRWGDVVGKLRSLWELSRRRSRLVISFPFLAVFLTDPPRWKPWVKVKKDGTRWLFWAWFDIGWRW